MASNITFMDDANTILDLFSGINQNIEGFPLMLLGVLGIIIFFLFQNYEIKQILLFEGFILSIVGVLMVTIGWMTMTYAIIPIILFAFAIFFNVWG